MGNLNGSNPTVLDCVFNGNRAGGAGGAMFNFSSNPVVTNCTFTGNFCAQRGGGMYNTDSNPTVSNCSFVGNQAAIFGAGMHNERSSPEVINCIFSENSAGGGGIGGPPWGGGGMDNRDNSSPRLTNCVFTGNFTYGSGGGVYNRSGSSPTITNCTFSGNSSWEDAGGMYNDDSNPTVVNSILWGNIDDSDGGSGGPFMDESAQIHDDGTSKTKVNYSCAQGTWSGNGGNNVDTDPLFVDADGPDNQVGTEDDDLRLSKGSPCIDKGSNFLVPADSADLDGDGNTTEKVPFDLDGNPRIVTCLVDMGAYEQQNPCTTPDADGDNVCDACDTCPGFDDAEPCPIPTVSEWGLIAMTLVVLTAGTVVLMRRRSVDV